jgi:hypothetical protein
LELLVKLAAICTESISVGYSNCTFFSFYTPLTFRAHIQKEVIFDLKRENQFLSKEIWESIHYKKGLLGLGLRRPVFVKRDMGVNTLQKRLAGLRENY